MQAPNNRYRMLAQSVERAVELSTRDPEMRAATASAEDLEALRKCRCSIAYVATACARYEHKPCLGRRQSGQPYTTQTYGEVWQRIVHLASAWSHDGQVHTGDSVGICGFASADWVVADLTCLYLAAVAVPLRTNMSQEDLTFIIRETEQRCIVCSSEQLPQILAVLPHCPTVQSLVIMDRPVALTEAPSLPTATLQQVEQRGSTLEAVPYMVPGVDVAGDPLMTLFYTSGSTGRPKGAMFPESVWHWSFRGPLEGMYPSAPMISVGFLPLNHMAGIGSLFQVMMHGGVTQFVQRSDMSTLFEDIRVARPTFLLLVPRVSEMLYQQYQAECIKRGNSPAAAQEARDAMRYALGDRLCYAVVGTAPTAPEVMAFLKDCFAIPVFDAYGATENGAVLFDDSIVDVVTDFKLVDVPELGYFVSDKPYPRGELRVKSPRVVPGYYKSPELSAGLRDADGFMKTGDIMEQRDARKFFWVDRKNNILKLAQGEFVSLSHLESTYMGGSPYIQQIYVYGTSNRSYLLAVVVPNAAAIAAIPQKKSSTDEAGVKKLLRSELDRIGRAAKVHSYEFPRDFLVEKNPFTKENGLLTESSKPSRPNLKQYYGAQLEALYTRIEGQAQQALLGLATDTRLTTEERVRQAILMTLGIGGADLDLEQQTFIQLGGDSLSAVRLCTTIEDVCGVAPPVGLLLDPTTPVAAIVRHVETMQQKGDAPTYESIHGKDAHQVTVQQLDLDLFLSPAHLANAAAPNESAQCTLLTGANGFLGRFLVLELLAVSPEAKLVCLVRARNNAAALQRLRDGYQQTDDRLAQQIDALVEAGRLQVVAGDLMQTRMGLDPPTYARLSNEVDTLVHNGALVNHALSYQRLFEPNVLGSVEVMRFAVEKRIKPLTFISTVGVPAGLQRRVLETERAADLWPARPVDSGYAVGYATSKWAAEVLLHQLHEKWHVPVSIFRCGMILGHSKKLGQININDFFTRLLHGVVHTGLAPRSFYVEPEGQHFDGMAVDFVAGSIARIASLRRRGWQTFHVVNPHLDDGMGLDRIMDWVESAGYNVRRVTSYAKWLERFTDALRTLPAKVRAQSPWPILYQWDHQARPEETVLDAGDFRQAVAAGTPWEDVPQVSEAFIHRCLEHMVHLGLIETAPLAASRQPLANIGVGDAAGLGG